MNTEHFVDVVVVVAVVVVAVVVVVVAVVVVKKNTYSSTNLKIDRLLKLNTEFYES